MKFPERIDDFINNYSFRDNERIYTNGSKLIPVYRVKQAIEHYMPKWIPVSERLPKESFVCEVTVKTLNGHIYTDSGYFDECKREWWKHDDSGLLDVIAWREPLLEPYKEENHGSNN